MLSHLFLGMVMRSFLFLDINAQITFEPHHEKTNILVSDLVRHKPGCIPIELGISDLGSRGIVLSM